MAKAKAAKKAKKVTVDWSDEDSVKAAMAVALEVSVDDLEIEEDRGYTSFREGDVYKVTHGRREYAVCENEDVEYELAIAIVKQDIEQEPEIFGDFLQGFIDTDHLRKELHSDVHSSRYDDLEEDAKRNSLKFMGEHDIDVPSPADSELRKHAEVMGNDEEHAKTLYNVLNAMDPDEQWSELGDEPEVKSSDIDKIADRQTDEQLKDPIAYLADIYGEEDGNKKAIEIGGIDEDAAAKEAVSADGASHFLSSYDGQSHEGPGGIVYWQTQG